MSNRFVNIDNRDYHMHSSNFSDGLSSIDEIVRFTGEIGLKAIAITDHSQFAIDFLNNKYGSHLGCSFRRTLGRWRNVINEVDVQFGVEGDLINENGDCCFDIQGVEPEFRILSAHGNIYQSPNDTITKGTIRAIERYKEKIAFIGHPCNKRDFGLHIDMNELVDCANANGVALEFNAKDFVQGTTDIHKLRYLLEKTDRIYINSDGHTLYELREMRKQAIDWLKNEGYIN
ncbi:PHP domain-containing protein [Candidatus Gracilibacteria bacterium]|nr:PHP domain-containing protein [Candidatus Gracilibacteria bacterium]